MAPPRRVSAGSNAACHRELSPRATLSKLAAPFLPPTTTRLLFARRHARSTKYRQNAGLRLFGVEVVSDLLRRRSVHDGGKGVRRCLPDPAHASEVFNQPLPRPWPHTRYRQQLTLPIAHLPPLAVIGHSKTVALIANLLHQVKHRRPPIQH